MALGEAEEQATALFNALYGEAQDLTQGIEESKPNIWDTDTSKLPNEAVKLMGKDNITQAATDYSKLNDDESTLFIDKFIKLLETIKPLGQNQQFTGANARALILNSIYVYSYKLYRAIALRLIEKQTNTNRMDAGYITSGSGAGNEGEDTHCSTSVLKSILSQAEKFHNLTRHVLSAQKVIPEIQQLISNKHPSLLREVILCPFPTEEIKSWSQMGIALMTVGLKAHINAINEIIHDNKQLLTDMHKAETEVAAEAKAGGTEEHDTEQENAAKKEHATFCYNQCLKMAENKSSLNGFTTVIKTHEAKILNNKLTESETLEFYQHCIQAITPSYIDLRKNKYHKTCPLTALICTGIFDGLLIPKDDNELSEDELNEFKENTKQYLNRQSKHTTSNAEHSSFRGFRSMFNHTFFTTSHTQNLRNKVLSTLLKKLQDYKKPSSSTSKKPSI